MKQDTEVIRQILDGDIEAFRLIVERYEGPVVRMIRNITGDSRFCEDIAQDVFFAAYKKLASFDPAYSKFSTWLFTIAKYKSINAIKRKRPSAVGTLPEKIDSHNPSDDAMKKEFFKHIDRQLLSLSGKLRRVFVLAEFEQLPYEEIAQIECVKVGTVRTRINRARNKLKQALGDIAGDIQ